MIHLAAVGMRACLVRPADLHCIPFKLLRSAFQHMHTGQSQRSSCVTVWHTA